MKSQSVQVCAFYRFVPIDPVRLAPLKSELERLSQELAIFGLILIGTEGINATISIDPSQASIVKERLAKILGSQELWFKDSFNSVHPFKTFKVQIRDEIVTLKRQDLVPPAADYHHLSPDEWDQMSQLADVVVLDTRNHYEYEVGKFRGAQELMIDEFAEFPERLQQSNLEKDKTYLIYCTGGIRCEKAILAMQEQGYQNVYQLKGGILNYLEQKGDHGTFDGECFVFDYRVALDQNLAPSQTYRTCPHCGQPAKELIQCRACGTQAKICSHCKDQQGEQAACSKNCHHHLKTGHNSRKVHRAELAKRHLGRAD